MAIGLRTGRGSGLRVMMDGSIPARTEASLLRNAPAPDRETVSATFPSAVAMDMASDADDIAALALDERGMIRDCSPAAEKLFRCRQTDLFGRHVSLLLPQLATLELMPNGEPNPRLRFLSRIGRHFFALTHDRQCFDCDLFLTVLDRARDGHLRLIVRPADETEKQWAAGA
jgi:hypothetical protein